MSLNLAQLREIWIGDRLHPPADAERSANRARLADMIDSIESEVVSREISSKPTASTRFSTQIRGIEAFSGNPPPRPTFVYPKRRDNVAAQILRKVLYGAVRDR